MDAVPACGGCCVARTGAHGLVAYVFAPTCPLQCWATKGINKEDVDEFVYHFYGLALAVLTTRMPGLLFLDLPYLGRGPSYLWREFTGLLPQLDGQPLCLAPGLPREWKWDPRLTMDLLDRANGLQWMEGKASYAELALHFEITAGQALLARLVHASRMTVLPLQERAAVLLQALCSLQPHMVLRRLFGQKGFQQGGGGGLGKGSICSTINQLL